MAIPYIHAQSSAKKYGGKPEDYLDIHELMDSSKAAYSNNAHRVITHNSWFTTIILPKVFGHQRVNSEGYTYNVKDVGEQHILEDFRNRFIPTVQDYLEHLDFQPWMNNGQGGDVPNRLKSKEVKLPAKEPTQIQKFESPNEAETSKKWDLGKIRD